MSSRLIPPKEPEMLYRLDKFIHTLGVDAKRGGIDSAECFEEDARAFHHRHAGPGANISQPRHASRAFFGGPLTSEGD